MKRRAHTHGRQRPVAYDPSLASPFTHGGWLNHHGGWFHHHGGWNHQRGGCDHARCSAPPPPAPSIIGISSSGIIMSPDGFRLRRVGRRVRSHLLAAGPSARRSSMCARAARAAGAALDAARRRASGRAMCSIADMSGAAPPPGSGRRARRGGAPPPGAAAPPPLSMPIICCIAVRARSGRLWVLLDLEERRAAGRNLREGRARRLRPRSARRRGRSAVAIFSGRRGRPEPDHLWLPKWDRREGTRKADRRIFERPVAHFPAAARAPVARPTNAHFGVTRWVDAMRPVSARSSRTTAPSPA